MSLASYLASKYLTAESSTTSGKKRKRSEKKHGTKSLIIADDDILGWNKDQATHKSYETDKPLIVNLESARKLNKKKNTWKKVGGLSPISKSNNSDADEADKIIAETVAEKLANQNQDEESPVLVDDLGIVKMENGSHAGLQSAKSVAKQFEKRKQEEQAAWTEEEQSSKKSKKSEETVYRDATGRRIDLALRRQEAQREAVLKAAKEKEKLKELNGDFQRAEKEKRKEILDEARFMPLTRSINDKSMNKELKEKDRWNDPAAKFLLQENKGGISSKRPLYVDAVAPNRYKIRPGYRWDGVDRGNGWEAKRFNALNTAARNRELSYSWQTDE